MAKECFWQGDLIGRNIDLFYNKYPFADLHGLLVLDKADGKAQYLEADDHHYVFELTKKLNETITGSGFGYNSYGAYASVNHLHFQMFVDEQGLPVIDQDWKHNGGSKDYPTECQAFDSAAAAWQYIESLHKHQQPYNILYYSGIAYVFPRKTQGTVDVPLWSSGFTWYELAGGLIMFNHDDYMQLKANKIEQHLVDLKPYIRLYPKVYIDSVPHNVKATVL